MQQFSIREATLDDVPAVVALVESAYRGDGSRAGWTTEADLLVGRRTDEEDVTRLVGTPGNAILVAIGSGGEPIGCCHVQERADGTAYFGLFAVRPTAQGGGIGGALLAAAEQRAADWGATEMEMTVIGQREDLIAWYRRKGYRPTGRSFPWPPSESVRSTPLRDDLYFAALAKPL